MMHVDDLVAAISSLQRSDLEAWIHEELVVPRQEAGTLLFTEMDCAGSASSARCTTNLRLMRARCRWCCRCSINSTTPGSADRH